MINHQPFIFDIKGNSLDDGPGIRTVVFIKGCPLNCFWCHNPESKRKRAELSFDKEKCVACGTCTDVCPENAISLDDPNAIDRDTCSLCFSCVKECPSEALACIGEKMEITDIVTKIQRYKSFYATSGGGVTLSGGEPTLFMDFTSDLLKWVKRESIHTLIETCGLFDYKRFNDLVLTYVDMVYMDIKFIDSNMHQQYCGTGNEQILDNFKTLYQQSCNGRFELLPRIPLIPDITDSMENLEAIACFMENLRVKKIALLPNNPLWFDKCHQIGQYLNTRGDDPMREWYTNDQVEAFKVVFQNKGIAVV